MSIKFYSPYQFVPINTQKIERQKWKCRKDIENTAKNHYIRHDRWSKEAISARIHYTITTLSPLVIGKEQGEATDQKPATVKPYTNKQGKPSIPANSLRGMISSIAETISQSSLRVLNDINNTYYSVRKDPKKALKNLGVLIEKEKGNYVIYPLPDDYRSTPINNSLKKQGSYQHFDNNSLYKGRAVYFRGIQFQKNKPLTAKLINWNGKLDQNKEIPVPTEVVTVLNSLLKNRYEHQSSPEEQEKILPVGYVRDKNNDWEKGNIVKSGDIVYFAQEQKNKEVTEISYSAIWRKYTGNLYESLKEHAGKNSLPWNKNRNELSPAECLFGVVEDDIDKQTGGRNLASRIRFSDAKATDTTHFETRPLVLKKLDSPKPPSPAMYFSAAQNKAVSKQQLQMQKHSPNGRKHYIPHNAASEKNTIWETSVTEKFKQHLQVTPVKKGGKFNAVIEVENLSKAEFDLLLSALEPAENNQDYCHRLGLGKPYGLGQIQLDIEKIETINRQQRYSLTGLNQPRYQKLTNWKTNKDTKYIDTIALQTLQTLGNPNNVLDHPICYPFTTKQKAYNEKEGFEWFSNNDRQGSSAQHLKAVQIGKPLQPLKSNER